jgi:hypothetical protein
VLGPGVLAEELSSRSIPLTLVNVHQPAPKILRRAGVLDR